MKALESFNSYNVGNAGARFLIDENGLTCQTALLTWITYHVGKIKSRCYETRICPIEELDLVTSIYFKRGQSFKVRIDNVNKHEKTKSYPDLYPTNDDSIGIEIVSDFLKKEKIYQAVNLSQNNPLKWLVSELYKHYSIDSDDVYRHPKVSRKEPSEASTADWK